MNRFSTRGFTLAEVILTVAVLAVLTTLTTPAIIHFMRQRDIREETTSQLAIRDAAAAMLKATGDLPDDTATGSNAWYNRLAQYTSLSPYQMQYDQWGQPRAYIMLRNTQTMLNTSVRIFYLTLHSKGPDLKAAQITDGGGAVLVPASGNDYAAAGDTRWWKFNVSPLAAFGSVGVPTGVDDILLRYTDYPEKTSQYNATLERMGKVTEGLETYSRARYAERVVACNSASPPADCGSAPPEQQIHYPMGWDGLNVDNSGNTGYYNGTVLSEASALTGGGVYFYNGIDNNSRRTNMILLMRLLGLPDDYCCSAIERFTDSGGIVREMPFYYFSNPRPRATASTCGTRPTLATTKLPARLTTTLTPDGTNGATCG